MSVAAADLTRRRGSHGVDAPYVLIMLSAGATRRFIEMVFEQVQQPVRLQSVPKLAITLLSFLIPPMAGVKETLYQSERPWVVDHSKYARRFGSRPTPHQQAIAETLSWFRRQVA